MNFSFNPIMPLTWTVSRADEPSVSYPAAVPGAVQLDLASALGWPDYRYADNYRMFAPLEDVDFVCRSEFMVPEKEASETLWFVSKGIDYECRICLNGHVLATHEGAVSQVEVCLEEYLLPDALNVLEVVVLKAPKKDCGTVDRVQASECCKAPVSYEWDWHPRLIPSGMWDDSGLQTRGRAWLSHARVGYTLSNDFSRASIALDTLVEGDKTDTLLRFILSDHSGKQVMELVGDRLEGVLDNPHLWWTWDQGTPYLYNYRVKLVDRTGEVLDSVSGRVGFRRVRLVMNEGAWDRPEGSPKSRSDAPAQIELNGRRIFARGTNWVAPEIFVGLAGKARYSELLALAREANFNLLRCWGGCMVSKDCFFEECDERGIMVWQEFPLACNKYPDTPEYLAVLEQEARAIVDRVSPHPCLAILCGGNELFNSWSGMDDQSLPLRLLNKVCYEMVPHIPFIATSPLNGMCHGNYLFRHEGREVYQWMDEASSTAYTEFGVPGISPREVLEGIIPAEELFPVGPTAAWTAHHAFGAWDGNLETWLGPATIEYYFGKSSSLDELIAKSSLLQGEGYKAIYEEARRQKPYCSMALNWDFNEPWPTAANNSIVCYPAVPKPSFKMVSAACRPVCSSAKFMKFLWEGGEVLEFSMWLLNDSYGVNGMRYNMSAMLVPPDGTEKELLSWATSSLEDNENQQGPTVRVKLPDWPGANRFTVKLLVSGHPEMDSSYTLAYRSVSKGPKVFYALNK
ncbi:MAG: hypothetical protein MJY56_00540 [Bacteroidales bacterium]|nr:hypothetical protein [Bacteroidales bacterium]